MPQQLSRRGAMAGLGAAAALTAAACGRVRADPATGVAAARRPAGTLLWQSRAVPADQPGIVVAAGRVYVTGGGQGYGNSGIYAFDAATGRRLWRTPGSSGPYPYAASASAVYGFTVTRGGATEVSASEAATGRTLWTHDAGQMLDSAKVGWLAYAGGLVYIAAGTTDDNTAGQPAVRALDARTGRRVWRASAAGPPPQTPAVAGGLVFIEQASSLTAASGYLAALDAATGASRWRSANLGGAVYSPVAVGGVVCCTAESLTKSVTFGLDSRNGSEIWHASIPGLAMAGTQDIVFLLGFQIGQTTSSFTIWARNARTGALAWTRQFPGGPALAMAGGVLYLGYGTRTLQAIAAATGQPRWTRQLDASPADLATDGSAVYALDGSGGVYALQA